MVPRADIPRSKFNIQSALKTTFDGAWLVPIYVDEVLPGDAFNLRMTAFCRLATPTTPVMDNLHMDTFWFFVPNRLVWNNWQKFQGEQTNPGDSISYVTPQQVSPASGYLKNSLQDYMGLPTVGQVAGGATVTHSALPLRAYNLIYNEWFRDENLQNSVTVDKGDGPDAVANYTLKNEENDMTTSHQHSPGHKKEQALVSLWEQAHQSSAQESHQHGQHPLELQKHSHKQTEAKSSAGIPTHQRVEAYSGELRDYKPTSAQQQQQQLTNSDNLSRYKNYWNAMRAEEQGIQKSSNLIGELLALTHDCNDRNTSEVDRLC